MCAFDSQSEGHVWVRVLYLLFALLVSNHLRGVLVNLTKLPGAAISL